MIIAVTIDAVAFDCRGGEVFRRDFRYTAAVSNSISPADLPKRIQHLLDERQQHVDAISRFDKTIARVITALNGGPTAPPAMETIEHADLTQRELQTLKQLLMGRSEAEAAKKIGVSAASVHIYIRNLFKKFRVNSRAKLMAVFTSEVARKI
jgi:DNA-binding NarL/FixJ family response regulator